jgi:hypothetical protein
MENKRRLEEMENFSVALKNLGSEDLKKRHLHWNEKSKTFNINFNDRLHEFE